MLPQMNRQLRRLYNYSALLLISAHPKNNSLSTCVPINRDKKDAQPRRLHTGKLLLDESAVDEFTELVGD